MRSSGASTTMTEWRAAAEADAPLLADLERDANLVALGHVFPAADHPFPYDEVLARWRSTLADPGASVSVVEGAAGLEAYVAHDGTTLRHLAVRPDRWGLGLGSSAVGRAEAGGVHRLWCLDANHPARRLYERRGWRASGEERAAEWPPYPLELEYVRAPG
jgi:GNAT superfamily N-acetyltransferase